MATLADKYFSKIDLDAIETAIGEAELSTSGEIAVEITSRSRNWRLERLTHSFVIAMVCGLLALYFTRENNWGMYYNFTQTVLWGIMSFVVGYIGWGLFLKRRSRAQKVVWLKAVDQFHLLEPVRGMAGVLIFVSLEEGEAAIVGDKGIASNVTDEFWPKLRVSLVDAMKKGDHAEGVIDAIKTVGKELAAHFPHESDDQNELPDRPSIID